MSWVKIDDGFPQHPKVAGLNDRAFRAHVKGMCYCARFETDGRIPRNALAELGIKPSATKDLEAAGIWRAENGSFWIHDFNVYNPSKAEKEARREEAAQRMRRVRANNERTSPEPDEQFTKRSPYPGPSPIPHPVLPSVEEGIGNGVDVGEYVGVLKDSTEETQAVLAGLRRHLPEAAFRTALESLERRRGEKPPLASETRYFVAALNSMRREGQYA